MVHALEEIRRILRPAGTLIDMHPVPEPESVEVHQGGKIDLVGYWSVPEWLMDERVADDALAEVTRRGLFNAEQEAVFDSLTHYDSVSEMLTDLKEVMDRFIKDTQVADEALPDLEALAARAEELMPQAAGTADLIFRERIHILRLKPA